MFLLYHETATDGEIATSEAKVAGEHHPARRYKHNGHFVEIDGPDHLVEHDANDICKIAGYRLATPQEQEIYLKQKRKANRLAERNQVAGGTDESSDETISESGDTTRKDG